MIILLIAYFFSQIQKAFFVFSMHVETIFLTSLHSWNLLSLE